MNRVLFSLLLILTACGVAKRQDTSRQPAPTLNGIYVGEQKKIFLRPTTELRTVGENTRLTYQAVTENLVPLNPAEYSVRVEYSMPTCPGMRDPKATPVRFSAPGGFETTYNITMGGEWLFVFTFSRAGTVVDRVRFSVHIPEE